MSNKQMEQPLLRKRASVDVVGALLQAAFAVIGLASSILWNQLMLCVAVLTQLFGKPALAKAATSQNCCCAVAMLFLTFGPRLLRWNLSACQRLILCACSYLVMIGLGLVLAQMLRAGEPAEELFLILVAINGLCTGLVQNVAASLSTSVPGASSALLFGESLSPLLAVSIAIMAETLMSKGGVADLHEASFYTIVTAEIFVCIAIVGVAFAWRSDSLSNPEHGTIADALETGGYREEYFWERMHVLFCNSCVALLACCAWVFLLCASPFIAEGLCQEAGCAEILPQRMISIANIAATLGRFLALKVSHAPGAPMLVLESLSLLALGLLIVLPCVWHWVPEMPFSEALVTGLPIAGGITLWSNSLLMRNDHSSQAACGHSIYAPCPVTTEITWLSLQVGSISGTLLAAAL